jgi:hypothetical protein
MLIHKIIKQIEWGFQDKYGIGNAECGIVKGIRISGDQQAGDQDIRLSGREPDALIP